MLNRLSRHCFCTATPRPWLFVGLGNPGDKYKGTRHNVGFELIDAFAESQGISMNTVHCKAIFGQGFVDEVPVFIAKPQTYMNLSGESTGPLAAYYKLPLNRVLVFHDDLDLPCGVLRLHHKGGHGSHNGDWEASWTNGSQSILAPKVQCNSPRTSELWLCALEYVRLQCNKPIDAALEEGVGVLKLLLSKGLTESARCFNREQKYKHIRLQTMPT
ncbi:peptidyl-tRNA hydrolase, mitochondrial isoform X2 [Juglans microcarpa x Juglans regia]|uniref:peptidyl-tRNA hydrolase, mitochondrial isoform X2 n=1 Tax=Juglans microcarpa x Juglans regia TaxID=2249226 RepID=UPI001B7E08F0|nr:peptidyl-tRNA hydrolase, mitochondrial isoform X2 [Juglans microcarpa x Juglans regia]